MDSVYNGRSPAAVFFNKIGFDEGIGNSRMKKPILPEGQIVYHQMTVPDRDVSEGQI